MSGLEKKYNLKSPAVKRLMREAVELKDPTHQYHAQPLEDNLFEWHFTVRGSPDTEFAGGQYHGRITLPAEYPMKPPSIILLTPNGRFEVGKKICLSMSAHHPETWQPSWSLRTVLLALIGFMPTKGAGAIGALDYSPEERRILAVKSNEWTCEMCGFDHGTCLLEADPGNNDHQIHEAKELAAHIDFKGEGEKVKENEQSASSTQLNDEGVDQPSGVENIQDGVDDPGMVIRQRGTTTNSSHEERSNSNESHTLTEQPSSHNQTVAYSMADYLSLVLLWIVAAILVILILRRLASEGNSLTKSNY